MKKLQIVTVPNPALLEKSRPVEKITPELKELVSGMVEILRSKPGLGLAAPQIGHNIRLVIIESKETKDDEGNILYEEIPLMVLINPEIIKFSKEKIELDEGCFSVPDVYGPVTRPKKIRAKATDITGKEVTINTNGLLARVLQHEIDHLDGILFTSRVTDPKTLRHIESEKEMRS